MTVNTVSQLLNIPITQYVALDRKSIAKFVDTIGGINLYVENNMDTLTLEEAFKEETGAVVLEDGKYKASNITRYYTDSEHGIQSARRAIESETLIKG